MSSVVYSSTGPASGYLDSIYTGFSLSQMLISSSGSSSFFDRKTMSWIFISLLNFLMYRAFSAFSAACWHRKATR